MGKRQGRRKARVTIRRMERLYAKYFTRKVNDQGHSLFRELVWKPDFQDMVSEELLK